MVYAIIAKLEFKGCMVMLKKLLSVCVLSLMGCASAPLYQAPYKTLTVEQSNALYQSLIGSYTVLTGYNNYNKTTRITISGSPQNLSFAFTSDSNPDKNSSANFRNCRIATSNERNASGKPAEALEELIVCESEITIHNLTTHYDKTETTAFYLGKTKANYVITSHTGLALMFTDETTISGGYFLAIWHFPSPLNIIYNLHKDV